MAVTSALTLESDAFLGLTKRSGNAFTRASSTSVSASAMRLTGQSEDASPESHLSTEATRLLPTLFVQADAKQYDALKEAHSRLMRKAYLEDGVGLSKREKLELQLVRWAIDRAELAIHAADLGRLEKIAEMQEKLASEIAALNQWGR